MLKSQNKKGASLAPLKLEWFLTADGFWRFARLFSLIDLFQTQSH